MVVAVFGFGFLAGIAACVTVALLVERNSRGQKPPVVVSMVRHPGITVRFLTT